MRKHYGLYDNTHLPMKELVISLIKTIIIIRLDIYQKKAKAKWLIIMVSKGTMATM